MYFITFIRNVLSFSINNNPKILIKCPLNEILHKWNDLMLIFHWQIVCTEWHLSHHIGSQMAPMLWEKHSHITLTANEWKMLINVHWYLSGQISTTLSQQELSVHKRLALATGISLLAFCCSGGYPQIQGQRRAETATQDWKTKRSSFWWVCFRSSSVSFWLQQNRSTSNSYQSS